MLGSEALYCHKSLHPLLPRGNPSPALVDDFPQGVCAVQSDGPDVRAPSDTAFVLSDVVADVLAAA
jgi:hypothetical protein